MAPSKSFSQRMTPYAFILWGDKFEEEVTTVFATELRRAGLCVKLVGLGGLKATGMHGLVISCDITLGDALQLADQAICVILPCSVIAIKRIENDPRVYEFFKLTCQNQAQFVLQHGEAMTHLTRQGLSISPTTCVIYPAGEALIRFAHAVANRLATATVDS